MNIKSRRDFLQLMGKGALSIGASTFLSPRLLMAQSASAPQSGTGKNIVVINLDGGVDGLALTPFYTGEHTNIVQNRLRPTINTPVGSIIPHAGQDGVGVKLGFHPAMQPFVSRASKNIKIIQGYGIPGEPDRSHDTCQIIMSLGATKIKGGDSVGFLARLMDLKDWDSFQYWAFYTFSPTDTNTVKKPPIKLYQLDSLSVPGVGWESDQETQSAWKMQERLLELQLPKDKLSSDILTNTLTSRSILANVRSDILVQQVGTNTAGNYTESDLGVSLRDAMKILRSKNERSNLANYKKDTLILTGQTGYDTHSDQNNPAMDNLNGLLGSLATNLAVFYEDLVKFNLLQDTIVVVYSEFGRTLYENGTAGQPSVGTDHGHGSNTFVFGGPVGAGVIGEAPNASELTDKDYNALRVKIDYRNIFGDVFNWIGVNPEDIFVDSAYRYSPLGLIV